MGEGRCPISDTYWQTETGAHLLAPLPGVWPQPPGSATLPFFGIQPVVLDEQAGPSYMHALHPTCPTWGGPTCLQTQANRGCCCVNRPGSSAGPAPESQLPLLKPASESAAACAGTGAAGGGAGPAGAQGQLAQRAADGVWRSRALRNNLLCALQGAPCDCALAGMHQPGSAPCGLAQAQRCSNRHQQPQQARQALVQRARDSAATLLLSRAGGAQGYYFTGDGCRRDAEGRFWITGRVDDVINVSGHRIGTAVRPSASVSSDRPAAGWAVLSDAVLDAALLGLR